MNASLKFPKVRTIVSLLLVILGLLFLRSCFHLFLGAHGTVNRVSELESVYGDTDKYIQATFSNTLLQQFPFDGPIHWKLIKFKEPLVILKGNIDTNLLRKYVSDHPSTQFIWSGVDTNGGEWNEEGWPKPEEYPGVNWTNLWFKQTWGKGIYTSACLDCQVNIQSREVVLRSH